MFATLRRPQFDVINHGIRSHIAWKECLSGLQADKMLRNQTVPYLYILREGETRGVTETNYYVTFVADDLTVRHVPFAIVITPEGWYSNNGGVTGAHPDEVTIEAVLHLIMHCPEGAPKPFV